METTKRHKKRSDSLRLTAIMLFVLLLIGCSKDDGPNETISVQTQTFLVNGINNCDLSSGKGSALVFTIPYTVSDGVTISKLLIKTKASDGSSEPEKVNTQFTDNGNTITWATCFRFGSISWVEYEVQLESSNGTKSSVSIVRVNKPSGAN